MTSRRPSAAYAPGYSTSRWSSDATYPSNRRQNSLFIVDLQNAAALFCASDECRAYCFPVARFPASHFLRRQLHAPTYLPPGDVLCACRPKQSSAFLPHLCVFYKTKGGLRRSARRLCWAKEPSIRAEACATTKRPSSGLVPALGYARDRYECYCESDARVGPFSPLFASCRRGVARVAQQRARVGGCMCHCFSVPPFLCFGWAPAAFPMFRVGIGGNL